MKRKLKNRRKFHKDLQNFSDIHNLVDNTPLDKGIELGYNIEHFL